MSRTATGRSPLDLLYAVYAWFILIFVALPVLVACLLLPGLSRRRAAASRGAAAVFLLIGSRIRVSGTPPCTDDRAVVIANHQSYLDGIILTAVLPPQYTFLIKREMVTVPIAGLLLKRLGSEFVDRQSADQRHRSARRLLQAAAAGQALAIFPEGTFDATPGLKRFHMGAFRAAWRAGLPILPIAIRGARDKLGSESWLPRRGPLFVDFRPPLPAADYADDTALMLATREAIVARLGEPDLIGTDPAS
jgi:1-acyl-sn-glycerol-3-phosphate acyltransferase